MSYLGFPKDWKERLEETRGPDATAYFPTVPRMPTEPSEPGGLPLVSISSFEDPGPGSWDRRTPEDEEKARLAALAQDAANAGGSTRIVGSKSGQYVRAEPNVTVARPTGVFVAFIRLIVFIAAGTLTTAFVMVCLKFLMALWGEL